jgi:hypothetical protein
MNDDYDVWQTIRDFIIAGVIAFIAVCTAFVASGYLTWWLL